VTLRPSYPRTYAAWQGRAVVLLALAAASWSASAADALPADAKQRWQSAFDALVREEPQKGKKPAVSRSSATRDSEACLAPPNPKTGKCSGTLFNLHWDAFDSTYMLGSFLAETLEHGIEFAVRDKPVATVTPVLVIKRCSSQPQLYLRLHYVGRSAAAINSLAVLADQDVVLRTNFQPNTPTISDGWVHDVNVIQPTPQDIEKLRLVVKAKSATARLSGKRVSADVDTIRGFLRDTLEPYDQLKQVLKGLDC
jgi:hypothetical protein